MKLRLWAAALALSAGLGWYGVPTLAQNTKQSTNVFKGRLSKVPVDAKMLPIIIGIGQATGTLNGSRVTIAGTFEGLGSPATVARLLTEAMATRGRPDFPIHTIRLGINPLFAERPEPPSWQPEETYAIVCGALEYRKNHRILLDAWEILHARHGRRTPWLLIAGSAANAHTDIAARLRASPALSARVRIAMDLPTVHIAQLMAGASMLLMPSFAEGFGLPPLEAMATGTPALVARSLAVPSGHTASGTRAPDASRPLSTSFTVPSPPAATINSAPFASASRAAAVVLVLVMVPPPVPLRGGVAKEQCERGDDGHAEETGIVVGTDEGARHQA